MEYIIKCFDTPQSQMNFMQLLTAYFISIIVIGTFIVLLINWIEKRTYKK